MTNEQKLRAVCPHCDCKPAAQPKHVGKQVKCPGCSRPFQVLRLEIPRVVLEAVPGSVAQENGVLPLAVDEDGVTLAFADPSNYELLEKLTFILNRRVKGVELPAKALAEEIGRHYGAGEGPSVESMLAEFTEVAEGRESVTRGLLTAFAGSRRSRKVRPDSARPVPPEIDQLLTSDPPRYTEAADRFAKEFRKELENGKHLVHCGMCYWLGVRQYFKFSARITIENCRSGNPDELFLTLVCNSRTFPGGLLGKQVRASVGDEDRSAVAECLEVARKCFVRGGQLGALGLALEWWTALSLGTGHFADCRGLLAEAREHPEVSRECLETLQGMVDAIPRYQADLDWLSFATEGWVIPTRDRLRPEVLEALQERASHVTRLCRVSPT